jgi:hypothetical protein
MLASATGADKAELEGVADALPLGDAPGGAGVVDGVGVRVGLARFDDDREGGLEEDAVTDADEPAVSELVGVGVGVRDGERVGVSAVPSDAGATRSAVHDGGSAREGSLQFGVLQNRIRISNRYGL